MTGSVGPGTQVPFVAATGTNRGISVIGSPIVTGSGFTIALTPKAPNSLAPGVYQDTITIRACSDSTCAREYTGSPATVTVTTSIGLDVTPAPVAVSVFEGVDPGTRNLQLKYYAGDASWSAFVTYSAGTGWLGFPQSGTTLSSALPLTFSAMPPGSYAATLGITASRAGAVPERRDINVTYEVRKLLTAGTIADFSVTKSQGATGQTRSVTIGAADSTRSTAWTATLDADSTWLRLSSSSGTTGAASTLALDLVPAEVAKLRNGRYVATITVHPALAGVSDLAITAALDVNRTQVATVAPYVVGAGRATGVILRGGGFDLLAVQSVRFGTAAGTSVVVDDPTRIRVQTPALPAGRYPITLVTATGTADSTAELVVQDPGNYVAAGVAALPDLRDLAAFSAFDPERRTCYLNTSAGKLVAMRAGPAGWTTQVSQSAPRGPMALTPDGRELLVLVGGTGSGTGSGMQIAHVDPVTLTETRRYDLPTPVTSGGSGGFNRNLAVTDDGAAVYAAGGQIWRYEPWRRTATRFYSNGSTPPFAVSANRTGNVLAWIPNATSTSVFSLDSRGGTSNVIFNGAAFTTCGYDTDIFGARWAFTCFDKPAGFTITDATGRVLTTVNVPKFAVGVLTDDGQRFAAVYAGAVGNVMQVFDLSNPVTGTQPPTLATTPAAAAGAFARDRIYVTPTQDEVVTCGQTVSADRLP